MKLPLYTRAGLERGLGTSLVILAHAGLAWWLLGAVNATELPRQPAPTTITATLLAAAPSAPPPPPAPAKPSASAAPVLTSPREARQHTPPPKPVQKAKPVQQPKPRPAPSPSSPPVNANPQATPAPASPAPAASPPPSEPARFDAAYLNNPAPAYPGMSRRLGEQGRVLLEVQVSPDGRALQVAVVQSSGSSRLDQAARNAVQRWRFQPATEGGRPVSSRVRVPIEFTLKNA